MRTEGRAWLVWGVAVAAYAVAIMQRASLGVAGQEAANQFGTTVAIVSTFVMVQLGTYTVLQIPAGVILDKYGSRAMLVAGSLIMSAGQLIMATADELSIAFTARILIGMGDACLFSSALRLLPAWFAPSRVPVLSQLTGLIGQLGQLAAVATLLPAIRYFGWTPGVIGAAAVSLVMAVVACIVVRNSPDDSEPATSQVPMRDLPRVAGQVMKHPATQLGFWVHFTSGFFVNVFLTMWGMPYLLVVQERSPAEASFIFGVAVIGGVVFGPVVGHLTARHPLRRSNLAMIVIIPNLVLWTAILLWPGPAPMWLLLALALAISAGGPGTGIGIDYPRTLLPYGRLGAANGVVISGSFGGATICLLVMAVALQWMTGGAEPTAEQLTWAMAIQIPFFLVGIAFIFVSRSRLRRSQQVMVPTWREVVERIRRQRGI